MNRFESRTNKFSSQSSSESKSSSFSFSESRININKYQYGALKEYSTIATIVPVEVKVKFYERCRELGLTPSEVLRSFVIGFIYGDVNAPQPKQISIHINMAVAKSEAKAEAKSSLEELVLREELQDLIDQAKDLQRRLENGADRTWVRQTAAKLRREIIKVLKQYKGGLPEDLKEEVLAALRVLRGLCST